MVSLWKIMFLQDEVQYRKMLGTLRLSQPTSILSHVLEWSQTKRYKDTSTYETFCRLWGKPERWAHPVMRFSINAMIAYMPMPSTARAKSGKDERNLEGVSTASCVRFPCWLQRFQRWRIRQKPAGAAIFRIQKTGGTRDSDLTDFPFFCSQCTEDILKFRLMVRPVATLTTIGKKEIRKAVRTAGIQPMPNHNTRIGTTATLGCCWIRPWQVDRYNVFGPSNDESQHHSEDDGDAEPNNGRPESLYRVFPQCRLEFLEGMQDHCRRRKKINWNRKQTTGSSQIRNNPAV